MATAVLALSDGTITVEAGADAKIESEWIGGEPFRPSGLFFDDPPDWIVKSMRFGLTEQLGAPVPAWLFGEECPPLALGIVRPGMVVTLLVANAAKARRSVKIALWGSL